MDPRQLEQTIQTLETSLKEHPENLEAMRSLAEAYLQHGDFHAAWLRRLCSMGSSPPVPFNCTIASLAKSPKT
jgi:hypothetical protein